MKPVYDHAGIQLYHGDCIEVMGELITNGVNVELVVTSPPYPGAAMWNTPEKELHQLNYHSMELSSKLLREGGVLCWQIADVPRPGGVLVPNIALSTLHAIELGLDYRAQVIWNKSASHLAPIPYMWRPAVPAGNHEFVLVFWNGQRKAREKRSGLGYLKKYMSTNVWTIAPETNSTHIAPYPYELARRCIGFWSLESETVIDPFAGSGTTLRVAKDMGRRAIGIEREERYVEMIIRLLEQEVMFFAENPEVQVIEEQSGMELT